MITKENDGYDAEANAYGCWKLAIRSMRLDEIRAGRATPRTDDAEEMEAAREAGFQVCGGGVGTWLGQ